LIHRPPKPDPWRRRAVLGALLALLAWPAAAAGEKDEKGEKGGKDGKQEPASTAGAPVFYDIPPIVLPVVEGNAVTRQVGVILTVELAEGHRKSEVRAKRRELTDAFITELYSIYGWRSGAERVVNETLIKRRLMAACDRVLGAGIAHAILIRQLVEQER
jgi:flagellar protein FliL